MKKSCFACLTFFLGMAFCLANTFAEMPSSKVTAGVRDIAVVKAFSATANDYAPVFTQRIKTPEQKDLFVSVSLEVGLTTDTKVMSKQLKRALAEAEALVMIRVLVDGKEALPGKVTFARRKQTMIAEFAGDISDCLYIEFMEDGTPVSKIAVDEECIQPESLQLILDTMSAHSFNFIAPDVSVGEHTIEVEARIDWNTTVNGEQVGTEALATAYLGKGTVTVDCVRMAKGEIPEM
jgi:hypothetical protein